MNRTGLARYWRTLKYLRTEQLWYLIVRRIVRWPRRVTVSRIPLEAVRITAGIDCLISLDVPNWLGGRRFCFLKEARDFGSRIDWQPSGASRLWQYNLHYFDWLRQADCSPLDALAMVEEWIVANPPFAGTGWEPYPTSLRLVNWIGALSKLPAAEWPPKVIESIVLQVAWLARTVEYQIGANHLFVNLKALMFGAAFCGAAFPRIAGWDVASRLAHELFEQFLPDGGHYERSPMYHASLTKDLLELMALCRNNPGLISAHVHQRLSTVLVEALEWNASMTPPDGGVCLFNDAGAEIAPSHAALEAFACGRLSVAVPAVPRGLAVTSLAASGFFVVRGGADMVVFDAGPVGPDHQPGHVHCDLLSFEYFLAGRKVIGNCGNFDYEPGPDRAFSRSTRAHSTVEVDGEEQSEVWGVFRVGRRARPLVAEFAPEAGGARFLAAHDGYCALPGRVVHTREVDVGSDFTLWIRDRLEGQGEHEARSWLHCAPGLELVAVGQGFEIRDELGVGLVTVEEISCDEYAVERTPRFPTFGARAEGMSLCLTTRRRAPFTFGCKLRRLVHD